MKVKVVNEFLGIPKGTIGVVTTQAGDILEIQPPNERAMWIKFDCKSMPVGIPQSFDAFIAIINDEK